MSVIRPLKTGGCSICNASEENVGLRRCNHIGGNTIPVEKVGGVQFIPVNEDKDVKQEEKKVISYIKDLSTKLTKEEKEELISILRDEY